MGTLVDPYMSFGTSSGAGTFYVATTGNDANPGTSGSPWATFGFAVDQLGPGDTLIAATGTYYESGIGISTNGTSGSPITIQAAGGATPIVDGSLAAYRTSGNSAWENVSGHLWRTVATLPDPGSFGYTGRIDEGGTLYMLTAYNDNDINTGLSYLSAVGDLMDDANPYYMGPGITYNSGHIYIRLDPNSTTAQWSNLSHPPFVISDLDPRNHAIYLAPNSTGFGVDGDYVVIDGIQMRHHWNSVSGDGDNVTIRNLTMQPSRFGARVGGNGWTFDNVTMQANRPTWIARSDVKSFPEPAKDTRTGGIDWQGATSGQFLNGSIVGFFDGMLVLTNEHDLTITNTHFDDCCDDGVQLGSGAYAIEFGYNLVNGAGVSHDGSGDDSATTPDSVYVHHNVFDNTGVVFWARKPVVGVEPAENGDGGYLPCPVFGSHAVPDFDDPWKVYNNTIVAGFSPGSQGVNHYMYHGSAPTTAGQKHEAFNNLFNFVDPDMRVYRNANASTGREDFDYNRYNRTTPLAQFAIESVNSGGTPVAVTTDLAQWKSDMGWDAHSTESTTMTPLDGSYRPAISGPADGTGVDLSAKGWPGTSPGTTYIGAKAPV